MSVASRCCLIVPATSERFLAKARRLEVDEVVIDLEDAVPPAEKRAARERAMAAVAYEWTAPAVSVRVNALGTPWGNDDLAACACAGDALRSVVLPKADAVAIRAADAALGGADLRLQALLETPAGVLDAAATARATRRLSALIVGYADLGAALGRDPGDIGRWSAIQDLVLLAARANDVAAVDGPWMAVGDPSGLERSAAHAAAAGFDGKWAIHPMQVDLVQRSFSPSEDAVRRARSVLDALDAAARAGHGAVSLDGEMVDEAHREAALRVLARAGVAT